MSHTALTITTQDNLKKKMTNSITQGGSIHTHHSCPCDTCTHTTQPIHSWRGSALSVCATRGGRPRAEAYVSPPRAWREQGERAHRQTAVHPCHRPQRPHPTPPGKWVRSTSYHHADECGDSRWPSRLRRFRSGREFSVQALSVYSAEAPSKLSAETAEASRLLSGRLRAGAAAGRTSTESSSRPAFPSGPATSRRLCFVIGHCVRATVGSSNSTQCGSSAATLPILPHTGGSGPSGSGLFSIPTNARGHCYFGGRRHSSLPLEGDYAAAKAKPWGGLRGCWRNGSFGKRKG